MKLSQTFSDADSKTNKSIGMLNAVVVPQLQSTLGSAIQSALSDLNGNTSSANSQLSQGVTAMRTAGTQSVSAMSTEFNRVATLFTNAVQSMLGAAAAMDTSNLNTLIQLANTRNTNASNKAYTASLAAMNMMGPTQLSQNETNMTNMVATINYTALQNPSAFAMSATNLVTFLQSLIQNASNTQNLKTINVQNASITDMTTRLNSILTALNNTNGSIAAILNGSQTDVQGAIDLKRANVWGQINALNQSVLSTSQSWQVQYNATQNSSLGVQNSTVLAQTGNYSSIQYVLGNLTSLLRSSYIPTITGWGVKANTTLDRMTQRLADAKTALVANLSGNSSSGVLSSIDSAMAKVGAQQQAINDAMAASLAKQMQGLQNLTDRLGANKQAFQSAMAQLLLFQTQLAAFGPNSTEDSAMTLLNGILGTMAAMANDVTLASQQGMGNLTMGRTNASSLIANYNDYLGNLRANASATISQYLKTTDQTFTDARNMWDAFTKGVGGNRTYFVRTMNSALAMDQTTSKSLDSSAKKTNSIISKTLTGVSKQIEAYMKVFSGYLNQINGTSYPTVLPSTGDATNYGSLAASLLGSFQGGVDRSNSKNQLGIGKIASGQQDALNQLKTLYSGLYSLSAQVANKTNLLPSVFSNATQTAETKLNGSIGILNASGYGVPDMQASVQARLGGSTVIKSATDLSNRISASNGTLVTLAGKISQLNNTLAFQQGQFNASTNNTVSAIMNVVQTSASLNQILASQVATLIGAVSGANSSIGTAVGNVSTNASASALNLTNTTLLDASSMLANWANILNASYVALNSAGGIVSNLSSLNASLLAQISRFASNVTALVNVFNASAIQGSSVSSQMMTNLLATTATLKTQLNSTKADTTISSLQGVLDSVTSAVTGSTANTSNLLVGITGAAAATILGNSSAGQAGYSQASSLTNQALQAAQDSVSMGMTAAGSISDIMAANAQDRANSATAVVNSISANQALMSSMMSNAMQAAASSSSGLATTQTSSLNFPAFLNTVGSQLAVLAKQMDASNQQVAAYSIESTKGMDSEKVALAEGLRKAGDIVNNGLIQIRNSMQENDQEQMDLQDQLSRLSVAQLRAGGLLTYISQNISDVGQAAIPQLGLSDAQINGTLVNETSAFAALENRISGLVTQASASGFLSR